ncbi:MAG: hypothetical protein ACI4RD_05825 [Kiritimatiellia bacterium]
MTPQDIATDISAVNTTGAINASTSFTYTWTNSGNTMDDANTWD